VVDLGAGDPRCTILIFMGKSDPTHADRHRRQSMILVPRDTPGVTVVRQLPVFGYDDAPHGHSEVLFDNVRVPASNMLLGEGRGFEIAQGRLGPGRIHHCMRLIGASERALEALCRRAGARTSFGRLLSEQGVTRERIAEARIMIDQARLLVLHAAWKMDIAGNKAARNEIAMIKVVAPNVACQVLDWAIQVFGAAGVSDDFGLAYAYASARTLRLADGPDEVHREQIARVRARPPRRAAAGADAAAPGSRRVKPESRPEMRCRSGFPRGGIRLRADFAARLRRRSADRGLAARCGNCAARTLSSSTQTVDTPTPISRWSRSTIPRQPPMARSTSRDC
jgi:hypothetical protein